VFARAGGAVGKKKETCGSFLGGKAFNNLWKEGVGGGMFKSGRRERRTGGAGGPRRLSPMKMGGARSNGWRQSQRGSPY